MLKQNKLVLIRLATAAVMGMTILFPSPVAFARPAVSVDSVQASTIDSTRTASLTIEFKNSPTASGTLSGIPVRIARLSNIDLTTQEGWLAGCIQTVCFRGPSAARSSVLAGEDRQCGARTL